MAFPTVSSTDLETIELWDATYELASYTLLSFSGVEYKFNVSPLKPYGSERQNFKGDGTAVIGNVTFTIKVDVGTSNRGAVMHALLMNVRDTKYVYAGTYALEVAAGVGITSWAPLGAYSFRAEIEFIPASPYWMDGYVEGAGVA